MQRLLCGAAVLSCVVLVGCGPSVSDKLIGKWEAHPLVDEKKPPQPVDDSNPLKAAVQQAAEKLQKAVKFEVIFRDTGTGTIAWYLGDRRSELGSGNWKVVGVEGNCVAIEMRNLDDQDPEILQITLVDDDHFKFKPPKADRELTFVRVKQP